MKKFMDPVENVKLLPCPFCGSPAVMDRMHTAAETFWRHRARCTGCWCATDWESDTPEDCEKKWNRRKTDGQAQT